MTNERKNAVRHMWRKMHEAAMRDLEDIMDGGLDPLEEGDERLREQWEGMVAAMDSGEEVAFVATYELTAGDIGGKLFVQFGIAPEVFREASNEKSA